MCLGRASSALQASHNSNPINWVTRALVAHLDLVGLAHSSALLFLAKFLRGFPRESIVSIS
jgi:hypothetical protein